jgi:hypothetical protein
MCVMCERMLAFLEYRDSNDETEMTETDLRPSVRSRGGKCNHGDRAKIAPGSGQSLPLQVKNTRLRSEDLLR